MKKDIIVTRIINAPVEKVWELWTNPDEVTKWWGPADYASPTAKIDLQPGGSYTFAMQAPEYQGGTVSYTSGEYKEIIPMKKLAFTQWLSDAQGSRLSDNERPAGFPEEILVTIEFKDLAGMTELVITERGWELSLMSVYSYAGMHQSLDKLATLLKNISK